MNEVHLNITSFCGKLGVLRRDYTLLSLQYYVYVLNRNYKWITHLQELPSRCSKCIYIRFIDSDLLISLTGTQPELNYISN